MPQEHSLDQNGAAGETWKPHTTVTTMMQVDVTLLYSPLEDDFRLQPCLFGESRAFLVRRFLVPSAVVSTEDLILFLFDVCVRARRTGLPPRRRSSNARRGCLCDTFLKTADHVVAITIVPSLTSGWMPINGCCVHLITTLNVPMSDMRAFGGECHGGRSGGRYPEPGTCGVRRLKVTSVPINKSRMLT